MKEPVTDSDVTIEPTSLRKSSGDAVFREKQILNIYHKEILI